MSKWFAYIAVLSACATDPEPPEAVPWNVHAMSVVDNRTLIVADVGSGVAAGSIITIGSEVPLPNDPTTGRPVMLSAPIATDVAAGKRHACVISAQQVYCWGDHTDGALGAHRACAPPATEEGMPECRMNAAVMPTLPAIRSIVAGDDVTCATAMDDRVYCWGVPTLVGGSQVAALDPPQPVRLPDGSPLVASRVTIRNRSTCAIDRAQTAWCWGDGFGALPKQLKLANVVDVAVGAHHSCAITTSGLSCWGENRNGQVGDVAAARRCDDGACTLGPTSLSLDAVRVVVGERHTCALLRDGKVQRRGSNEVGQLGRSDAFLVGGIGVAIGDATDLTTSYARTCARLRDDSAWCWGEHVTRSN